MSKYILGIIGYILLVFVPDVVGIEVEVKEISKTTVDGLKVMTMVGERDKGEDYMITTTWKYTEKGRVRHTMKYVEKRKYYRESEKIYPYPHPSHYRGHPYGRRPVHSHRFSGFWAR